MIPVRAAAERSTRTAAAGRRNVCGLELIRPFGALFPKWEERYVLALKINLSLWERWIAAGETDPVLLQRIMH